MGLVDLIWITAIISGAVYLLYRSLWKKRGYCHGCPSATCPGKGSRRKNCSLDIPFGTDPSDVPQPGGFEGSLLNPAPRKNNGSFP